MNESIRVVLACLTLLASLDGAQSTATLLPSVKTSPFQAVPELPYRVVANFFKFPKGMVAGEAAGVAINSKGHIFLFQRTKPMLAEYDEKGVVKFDRSGNYIKAWGNMKPGSVSSTCLILLPLIRKGASS